VVPSAVIEAGGMDGGSVGTGGSCGRRAHGGRSAKAPGTPGGTLADLFGQFDDATPTP